MQSPRVGVVGDIAELASYYAEPPEGVRANMIFSADGAAAFGGRAGPLSSPTDQQLLNILRGYADVVLVGAGTARAENYGPVRLSGTQRTVPPPIAVVSRSGRLPDGLFADPGRPPILITGARSAAGLTGGSERQRVLVAGEDSVDAAEAVAVLRAQGMHRILCEGGPTLLDGLVEADAVVEICVTLAPRLAGNQPVGHRPIPSALPLPVAMRLQHALVHDDYVFLKFHR
jgi:riboflavin biosynthesis pyrimidine reductase